MTEIAAAMTSSNCENVHIDLECPETVRRTRVQTGPIRPNGVRDADETHIRPPRCLQRALGVRRLRQFEPRIFMKIVKGWRTGFGLLRAPGLSLGGIARSKAQRTWILNLVIL